MPELGHHGAQGVCLDGTVVALLEMGLDDRGLFVAQSAEGIRAQQLLQRIMVIHRCSAPAAPPRQ